MNYRPTKQEIEALGGKLRWADNTYSFGGNPERLVEVFQDSVSLCIGEAGCSCGVNLDKWVDFNLPSTAFFRQLLVSLEWIEPTTNL